MVNFDFKYSLFYFLLHGCQAVAVVDGLKANHFHVACTGK
jgi:hypothetical protein